jgi:hypothetical protein
MIGTLSGPILVVLQKDGHGLAVVDGVSLRVRWTGKSELRWTGSTDRRISLEMSVEDILDETQQRKKIERLEAELSDEREKLVTIRCALTGETTAADD